MRMGKKRLTRVYYFCPDRNNLLVPYDVCRECEKANTCSAKRVERKIIHWDYL